MHGGVNTTDGSPIQANNNVRRTCLDAMTASYLPFHAGLAMAMLVAFLAWHSVLGLGLGS